MIRLRIDNVDGYNYFLRDSGNSEYILNIEFYDLEYKPGSNDYIFINEKVLKENNFFNFGPLDNVYGRTISSSDDPDILILVTENKKIYMKRIYG